MSTENWQIWYEEQIKKSQMDVKRIPLCDTEGWDMQADGDFGRPDGAFFKFVGTHISVGDKQRELAAWDQPLVKEVGEGVVVVVKSKGQDLFLVQAKLEPGNNPDNGYIMLNAPLSASKSNLEAKHGGKKPPRAELYNDKTQLCPLPQDGGKYLQKTNHYGWVEVDLEDIEIGENERWFSRSELREALVAGYVAEHLSQAILVCIL